MNLLKELRWQVAPPPPTENDNSGGGRNDGWNDKIFNELENQLWMIQKKGWKNTIHIGDDIVKRYPRIPEQYIRSVMNALMVDPDNRSFTKYIIKGS